MLTKACNKNHLRACHNLAVMYKTGEKSTHASGEGSVPIDLELFQKYRDKTHELTKAYDKKPMDD